MALNPAKFGREDVAWLRSSLGGPGVDADHRATLHLRTHVGECEVNTIKLPNPYPFGEEADAHFETMILRNNSPAPGEREWLDMKWRYHTIEQARAGHEAAVYHLHVHLPLGDTVDFWRTSDHIPAHLRLQRRWPDEQK